LAEAQPDQLLTSVMLAHNGEELVKIVAKNRGAATRSALYDEEP
jgi:hypothetical protein